ncbi:MAG: L-serine ammonia-lyase, iron-sulfur-dependent, subunit alpha, partial [Lachnospiraceae bacterium]|nr:L-serine ammonia-lyase, iron-sulfur-dependent, subunit alpha [Lachnospiraceae bacterium]
MYDSLNQIIKEEKEKKTPFWKLVQLDDCHESETTVKESMAEVLKVYTAMKESVENYDASLKSHSGLVGGNG